MNLFTKLIFYLKRPWLIIVENEEKNQTAEAIFYVLSPFFKVEKVKELNSRNILKNRILILSSNLKEDLAFLVKKSKKTILVITNPNKTPRERIRLAKQLPARASLILNFDNEMAKEIGKESQAPVLTFGFQKRAELYVSDFHTNGLGHWLDSESQAKPSTNFKINYQGNTVPVWLGGTFKKENLYSVLAAVCCGLQFGLNLIEISRALKNLK